MLASSEAGQEMIEAQMRNHEESGGLFGWGKQKASGGHTHTPPVVILFHELGHINQLRTQGDTFGHWVDPATGDWLRDENGQPLIERQNVGLDRDTSLVPPGDGDTYDFTLPENGLREEIRLPPRERY